MVLNDEFSTEYLFQTLVDGNRLNFVYIISIPYENSNYPA